MANILSKYPKLSSFMLGLVAASPVVASFVVIAHYATDEPCVPNDSNLKCQSISKEFQQTVIGVAGAIASGVTTAGVAGYFYKKFLSHSVADTDEDRPLLVNGQQQPNNQP